MLAYCISNIKCESASNAPKCAQNNGVFMPLFKNMFSNSHTLVSQQMKITQGNGGTFTYQYISKTVKQ